MKPGDIIEKSVTSLRMRLEETGGQLQLQLAAGYLYQAKCTFFAPAQEEDLEKFMRNVGYRFPEDYLRFLKLTNGCRLFDDLQYGGEAEIYGWQAIYGVTFEEPNDGYLKIACIYQDDIVIDLKAYRDGSANYLMVKGSIDAFEEARPLNLNFELWFDRFIVSQGSKFWEWAWDSAEHYYKRRR